MLATDSSSRLYVKSYFADSIHEALELAKAELGPDALLMNEREAPPEARHQGAYEVVFGVRSDTPAVAQGAADPMADLQNRMDELRAMVSQLRPALLSAEEADSVVANQLSTAGVDEELAADIGSAVHRRIRSTSIVPIGRVKHGPRWTEDLVRETTLELESRIRVLPELGRICALVGPPGVGKTSTLVKLAVAQGLIKKRPVRLLSIDSCRIAAAEQLRTYAAIIGVPFLFAECTSELARTIESSPKDVLLFIDTPGYTTVSLRESGEELAAFFRSRQEIDTHLVLTASMRQSDLRRTVDRFLAFDPSKLLFTHLDETDSMGSIFSEAARTGRPVSFLTTGQSIPEDMEAASLGRITGPLVQELPQAVEAVA